MVEIPHRAIWTAEFSLGRREHMQRKTARSGRRRREDLKSHGNRTIAAIDEADAEYVPLYSDTTTHQVAPPLGNAF
jgi:hypothetical protein